MQMSPGDVLDRFTITLLKHSRGLVPLGELQRWRAAAAEVLTQRGESLAAAVVDLAYANAAIWRLEWAIRQGQEQELGLEEVGRRALAMREINAERVARKNLLNTMLGSAEDVERKADHVSADD